MTFTPYCPATLNRIRHQRASASDLGWDETFYRSVCRKHGIEPVASSDAMRPEQSDVADEKLDRCAADYAPKSRPNRKRVSREGATCHVFGVSTPFKAWLDRQRAKRNISVSIIVKEAALAACDETGPLPEWFVRGFGVVGGNCSVTWTPAERERIACAARERGLTVNDFLRSALCLAAKAAA